MVFAQRAALDITKDYIRGGYGSINLATGESCEKDKRAAILSEVELDNYMDDDAITEKYRRLVREEIQKADKAAEGFKDEEEYERIKREKEEAKANHK